MLERVIATLTESFRLIQSNASLARDLSALLPTFFSALLNLTSQHALLPPILSSLHILIPEHPTVFRPNLTRSSALMLSILEGPYPKNIKKLAARVYVDLHYSAQKGGNAEHWRAGILGTIAEVHFVLDQIFSVVEEGDSLENLG